MCLEIDSCFTISRTYSLSFDKFKRAEFAMERNESGWFNSSPMSQQVAITSKWLIRTEVIHSRRLLFHLLFLDGSRWFDNTVKAV